MARDNDNTFAQATDLGVFPSGNSITKQGSVGNAVSDDPVDIYRINISAPTRFVAALSSQGTGDDANLFLKDANGQLVDSSTNPDPRNPDIVSSDNLQPGVYFLEVTGSRAGANYNLGVSGSRITSAEVGVTVKRIIALERFDLKLPFSSSFRADFLAKIKIDGQERRSGVFNKDSDDVRPNFTFKKSVSPAKRFVDVSITGEDDDPIDINDSAEFGNTSSLKFDAIKGSFTSSFGFPTSVEGVSVFSEGTLSRALAKRARLEFQIDYNTFTASSASLQSAPMIVGKGPNITGQDIGGILVDNDRHNHLFAKGGNDAVCGAKGKDLLDAGKGNDITCGGEGQDIHISGTGRDVFVVDLDAKSVDLFKDFQVNRDRIGLPFALHPDMIDVVNHKRGAALKLGTDILAVVQGIKPNQFDSNNFVQVDFATLRGVDVPYIVSH
jgi:serralysin